MDATYQARPPAQYDQAQPTATAYLGMLRRHWWLALLTVVAGTAAAAAYTDTLPREYVSTASVLVLPAGQDANVSGGRTRSEINLDTEAQLVRSTAVVVGAAKLLDEAAAKQADAIAEAAGRTEPPVVAKVDPDELVAGVSVEVPANTSVLQIKFAATTPDQAQAGALAFARSYLSNREGNAKAELTGQTDALRAKLKQLNRELDQINDQLAQTRPTSAAFATLDSRRDTVQNQVNQLSNKINQISTEQVTAGNIIREPRLPSAPVKPRIPMNLAAGALLGLLLGIGLAALRERLDRRVRGVIDLHRTDIALLGEVSAKTAPRSDDVFAPFSDGGRCFNRLRNEVVAALNPGEQVVVVTGASRGPAATLVAANLAAALARTGTEVILVGAQLPESMADSTPLARLLGVSPVPGLSEVLAAKVSLSEAIQRAARVPSLQVITTGGTASAAGLLQSQSLRDIIATLRTRADFVVIEAPSTATGADAQSLASLADAAILAVELRRTKRPELADAGEQLLRVGTPLLGAVLMPKLAHTSPTNAVQQEEQAEDGADAVRATGDPAALSDDAPQESKPSDEAVDGDAVPAEANGHKASEDQTMLLAPLDASSLAELDEAHGR